MGQVDIVGPDGAVSTVCSDCGRPVSTLIDFQRAQAELKRELFMVAYGGGPPTGWMSSICWFPSERIDRTCKRRPQWASDLRISLARTLFSLYVGDPEWSTISLDLETLNIGD